ncbi:ATP-binding cassette transporter abc4 Short=ABC transporter abc4; AltName: Full=ATP-energized glutathione S-conjugate pump abc4; AltName: Full=Glutathione S-conjugate-transporting ATPase abc4 [Serendipita indica DSM 11827]|nr:ATP-binding cassette transporter abc4 Short=ABC transporter abc4; AltName: Full=ATP-energized glutathione S-conjugate pump abc4; AltName: Full=Glutathione S-conjugate-transporting ATPase abc4 [Serendipita indica DSM 11827]
MLDPFQVVLRQPTYDVQKTSIYKSTLLIPVYLAGVSFLIALVHLIIFATPLKRTLFQRLAPSRTVIHNEPEPPTGLTSEVKANIASNGGIVLWSYKVARLFGSLALFGVAITAAIVASDNTLHTNGKHWGKKHRHRNRHKNRFSDYEWLQIVLAAFYLYASVLALCTLLIKKRWRRVAKNHLNILLVAAWAVYLYRDVWPVATYTLQPVDPNHWTTWTSIALLTLVAVAIPAFMPHEYIPVDPERPSSEVNPEQTASWASFFLYSFLDPIIYQASKTDHLEVEKLPPLADYDAAAHLRKSSFPYVDPMRLAHRRHLFWGLLGYFYKEFIFLAFLIFVKVAIGFAGPLGINRLLTYIETGGRGAVIRPWVWILCLFLGPVVGSGAIQWYIFINTRNLVRIECIITQLVFEHSLRIRMKEEAVAGEKPVVETPEAGHIEQQTTDGDQTDTSTAVGSSSPSTSTPNGASTSKQTKKSKKETSVAPSIASTATSVTGVGTKKKENLVGKINNFVSTDLGNITDGRDILFMIWYTPLQISICVWFLYSILGAASFLGMGVLVASIPVPSLIGTILARVNKERMERTDARVQAMSEYINVLRMIKLFAWEPKVKRKVDEKRTDELALIKRAQFFQLMNMNTNYVIPLLVMIVTFSSYTLIFKHELTASRVFSSIAVFDMLRDQLHIVLWGANAIIQGKVSLDRITDFLYNTELLDSYADKSKDQAIQISLPVPDPNTIGFRNATFTWANTVPGTPTPGRRNFRLNIEGELSFIRGAINLIIGPTGCGKTSMLMALLGEMHFQPANPDAWYNLPRDGGVAFASQEPWITNQTIKENILFGTAFDEDRYKKVLHQCSLETDLHMFEAGDETEVGEKGITLSKGQPARAIYSHASIVLLDDVLSALDVHTSSWVVDKCFKGDLVKGRTILLVTHNVAMVSPVAKFVVALGVDGRISSQGTLDQALKLDAKLQEELDQEKKAIAKGQEVVDAPTEAPKAEVKPAGKLIVAEEVALGRVSWPALKMYLTALGNSAFWIVFLGGFFVADLLSVVQTFWLGHWASQYETHPTSEVNVFYYLLVYGGLLLIGMIVYSTAFTVYLFGALRASRKIHDQLITSIFAATLRWLDTTPVGRIISRFTVDIRAIDGQISGMLSDWLEITITMLVKLGAVVVRTPVFVLPGLLVGGLGSWLGNMYIKAQLSVKREMSNARAPVFSHFHASIAGLTSIRAYGAEERFREMTMERINKYSRCARSFYNLNRWISFRIDLLGALFSATLAAYLIYVRPESAANVGFSLTMAIAFSGMILWWVRIGNEFEVSCNSLERIESYIKCEQEPKPTDVNKPPAYWPSSGHLVVEKLSASYSVDGPPVLRDISFEIKSGERVGIVGRTGSGKSSLTLSLLRLIPTTGAVMYDGIETSHINLEPLRNNMTIIPQQPELLSGSVRENLDPFGEYDDAVLNDALRASGLNNVQTEDSEEAITLDTAVSSGGANFSLGQRQILSLARAICRQSKVLILDEATAAIDHQTDAAIQASIRNELKGVTVITVAHRLKTIGDSDKILVLDAGKLVEFDSPANLLRKKEGYFKSLVDQSGEKEELYHMAGIEVEHGIRSWFSK